MSSRFCPNCQTKLGSKDLHFCSNCGYELDLRPTTNSLVDEPTVSTQTPKVKSASWLKDNLAPLSIFLVLVLAGVLLFPFATRSFVKSEVDDVSNILSTKPTEPNRQSFNWNIDLLEYAPAETTTIYVGKDSKQFLDNYTGDFESLFDMVYVHVQGDFLYIADGADWGLLFAKVDNPTLSEFETDLNVAYLGDYLYVGNSQELLNDMVTSKNKLAKSILNEADYVRAKNKEDLQSIGNFIREVEGENILGLK